jgi:hypothetical protein
LITSLDVIDVALRAVPSEAPVTDAPSSQARAARRAEQRRETAQREAAELAALVDAPPVEPELQLQGISVHDHRNDPRSTLVREAWLPPDRSAVTLLTLTPTPGVAILAAAVAAERATRAALEEARRGFAQTEALQHWRRLQADLDRARAAGQVAAARAQEALAAARDALAAGTDPAPAENAFREAENERHVQLNREQTLAALEKEARAKAEQLLRRAIEQRREELRQEAVAEHAALWAEVSAVLGPRLARLHASGATIELLTASELELNRRRREQGLAPIADGYLSLPSAE